MREKINTEKYSSGQVMFFLTVWYLTTEEIILFDEAHKNTKLKQENFLTDCATLFKRK